MEKTEKLYKQLSAEERATIMLMQQEGSGLREIGRFLKLISQYDFTRD
jgi:Helix-turn-helix domain